jgi:DNA-binding response OmpR family regulator
LKTYAFGRVQVNFEKSRLSKNGHAMTMSERECRLLQYLIECKGDIVSRDELLRHVWGYSDAPLTRTVDVHISWLRQKIEDDPTQPQHILTVHGQGYRFSE